MIDELGVKIRDVLSKYDNAIELLKEIPGFSDKVVKDLVAEIGFDKRGLIAVAHSQIVATYLILSIGARLHELGAQYQQEKIEKKRKAYLTAELRKLGYSVELEKKIATE